MRLWHYKLIPFLPRQQLLGQHRECCALRGNGWGKKHKTVDYVFQYSPYPLYCYHMVVRSEMIRRGYHFDENWCAREYRGKACLPYTREEYEQFLVEISVYPEHDEEYLRECIVNLQNKGVKMDIERICQ